MKHKRLAGLLLSLNLLLVGAPTALAHETPSPSPSSIPLGELEQRKLDMEHYKFDMEQYRIDMNQRKLVREEIGKAFVTAIKLADGIAKNALRSAKNDKAKTMIFDQQQRAKMDAMLLRDQELEAMGDAPIEPTKPDKPIRTAIVKKTKTSKPSPTPSS